MFSWCQLEAVTPAAHQPSTAAADGLVKSALFKNLLVQPQTNVHERPRQCLISLPAFVCLCVARNREWSAFSDGSGDTVWEWEFLELYFHIFTDICTVWDSGRNRHRSHSAWDLSLCLRQIDDEKNPIDYPMLSLICNLLAEISSPLLSK